MKTLLGIRICRPLPASLAYIYGHISRTFMNHPG